MGFPRSRRQETYDMKRIASFLTVAVVLLVAGVAVAVMASPQAPSDVIATADTVSSAAMESTTLATADSISVLTAESSVGWSIVRSGSTSSNTGRRFTVGGYDNSTFIPQ